jgi:hypothetical protein
LKRTRIFVISVIALLLFSGSSCLTNTVYGASTVHVSLASQTATTISLSWTQTTDLIFKNYAVTYSTFVNGPYTTVATTTNASQTSFAVTGLNPNTPYYFIIQDTSNDIIGSSAQASNTLQANTNPIPQISSPSKTSTTVSLKWSDYNSYSSTVPFQRYVVQMSVSGGQWSTLTTLDDVSQSTYTVTGLSPATYQFRMYDQVGTSGQYGSTSNVITVTIPLPVQVQISSSTTSTNVGQQVQLTASASGGTNSYSYQWYSNGNPIEGATSASYTYYSSNAGTVNIYATAKDNQDATLATATSNSITLTALATPPPTNHPTPTPTVPELTPLIALLFMAIASCSFIFVKVVKKASKKQ